MRNDHVEFDIFPTHAPHRPVQGTCLPDMSHYTSTYEWNVIITQNEPHVRVYLSNKESWSM